MKLYSDYFTTNAFLLLDRFTRRYRSQKSFDFQNRGDQHQSTTNRHTKRNPRITKTRNPLKSSQSGRVGKPRAISDHARQENNNDHIINEFEIELRFLGEV